MITTKLSVKSRNLEVQKDGICRNMNLSNTSLLHNFSFCRSYRLDKYIQDLNHLIELTSDDLEIIKIGTILTRRFLQQSPRIADLCPPPDLERCVASRCLYNTSDSKFRIDVFSWLPQTSNVHSHGTWSIVALLGDYTTGRELNYFWRREDNGLKPNHAVIKPITKEILEAGDIIGFTSDAIHNIKSLPPKKNTNNQPLKPTIMFNIFGSDNPDKQHLFNPFNNTYKNY